MSEQNQGTYVPPTENNPSEIVVTHEQPTTITPGDGDVTSEIVVTHEQPTTITMELVDVFITNETDDSVLTHLVAIKDLLASK